MMCNCVMHGEPLRMAPVQPALNAAQFVYVVQHQLAQVGWPNQKRTLLPCMRAMITGQFHCSWFTTHMPAAKCSVVTHQATQPRWVFTSSGQARDGPAQGTWLLCVYMKLWRCFARLGVFMPSARQQLRSCEPCMCSDFKLACIIHNLKLHVCLVALHWIRLAGCRLPDRDWREVMRPT